MKRIFLTLTALVLCGFLIFGCTGTSSVTGPSGGSGNPGGSGGSSGTTYIGTQSPGDLWTCTMNDSAGTFTCTDRTTSTTINGTISTSGLVSGFMQMSATGATAYAVEMPGGALMIWPQSGFPHPTNMIVAAPSGSCPSSATFNMVNIPSSAASASANQGYMTGINFNGTSFSGMSNMMAGGTQNVSASGLTCGTNCQSAANGMFVADMGGMMPMPMNSSGYAGVGTGSPPSASAATSMTFVGFSFTSNGVSFSTQPVEMVNGTFSAAGGCNAAPMAPAPANFQQTGTLSSPAAGAGAGMFNATFTNTAGCGGGSVPSVFMANQVTAGSMTKVIVMFPQTNGMLMMVQQ